MAGICTESQHDCGGLSALLAKLPDPSLGHGKVEAMPVTEARERGLIPKACEDTLRAFSSTEMKLYKHATTYHSETPTKSWKGVLQNARTCCIGPGMDSRAIAAKEIY